MIQVAFDTYADGGPYRRDFVIVNYGRDVDGINNFDGVSGTLVVDACEMIRCSYCWQWEKSEVDRCGGCGQHM